MHCNAPALFKKKEKENPLIFLRFHFYLLHEIKKKEIDLDQYNKNKKKGI